ncbi:glucokinase [Thermomonospora curvata]|uniref:Glucokinase n=1 Tax=Thermomonospora curvata (strain ATCC 19995 / DSM 43183 / JCM 3096 / KCTC 9072 / NBRC 15933 / NCIMB 10081 / Henssen B9) TaxID=471852 RepID=D1AC51_THECD|nr:glucokinase [Thermomonospora curvata DSM 43183]
MTAMAPSAERPWLVADIGGTNARFGLIQAPGAPPSRVQVLALRDHAGLAEATATYLARHAGDVRPGAACVAVAGPVTDDGRFQLTNAHWSGSAEEVRADLGLDHVELINDFEALALALPTLQPGDLRVLGERAPGGQTPAAVLGPGTGLGVAALVRAGERLVAIPSEGGHVDLPATTPRELELAAMLREEHGTAEAERLLSGEGMTRLYELIARMHAVPVQPLSAAQICARRSDPLCQETLETFCALLGSFAGNVALTFGARGGVYLGGGILPRIWDVLRRSDFRRRFESKPPMERYLRAIPTALIVAPTPALAGAAARLASLEPV